jgi:hypothetical protein
MLVKARAWPGRPLDEHHGRPLVHDMLVALGILKPTEEKSDVDSLFENSCHGLEVTIDQTFEIEADEDRVLSTVHEDQSNETCFDVDQLEPLPPFAVDSGTKAIQFLPPSTISPEDTSRTSVAQSFETCVLPISPLLSSAWMTGDETLTPSLYTFNDYGCLDKVSAWQHDLASASSHQIDVSWLQDLLSQFPSLAEDLFATTEPYPWLGSLIDWSDSTILNGEDAM